MTGLERNADVVTMTSYAPLFAHADGWQWTPDLIWFNNLQSYATPNYYVQKLFSNNKGSDLLRMYHNKKSVSGQDKLYATAVKDNKNDEVIIKIVNTDSKEKTIEINPRNIKLGQKLMKIILTASALSNENNFKTENIQPVEDNSIIKKGKFSVEIPANSLVVLKIK